MHVNVAWEETSYKVYDPFHYAHFYAVIVSGSVVPELDCPCGLVRVSVNKLFHLRDLSVLGSLGADEQDICHAIGFVDGVRHVS